MNYLMSAIVILLLVGIPLLKYVEKEAIQRRTGEKILLEMKQKTNKIKVIIYFLLAILVLFIIPTKEVTLYLAIMKLLFIIGLYFSEEQLKTRIYLTNKSVYMVKRMSDKKLVTIQKFKKSQLYRIDLMPKNDGVYRLYFNGEKNYLNTLDVKITQKDDLLLFRTMIKKNLDIYINEPIEIEEHIARYEEGEETKPIDTLTKYFVLSICLFIGIALLKETFFSEDIEKTFGDILASVVAMQFIPFTLYLSSYIFMKVSGKTKYMENTKVSKKELGLLYILGATTLPFVVLMNHDIVDGQRFIVVHLLGFAIIALCMIAAWVVGKITKLATSKEFLSFLDRMVQKTQEQKKNA